jgi:hypothetical protein
MTSPRPRTALPPALRMLRKVPLVSHFPPATPPPAGGQDEAPQAEPGPRASVTMWQVIMYALDGNGRTVRLCVIILVAALAALLVYR